MALDRREKLHPVQSRSLESTNHHVDRFFEKNAKPLEAVIDLEDLVEDSGGLDRSTDLRTLIFRVVDDEQRRQGSPR